MHYDPQVANLASCIRIFPHQNDSGGFFVAVLEKVADHEVDLPRLPHKPLPKWREPPFRPLTALSTEIADRILSDYGFPSSFNPASLFVHDDSAINNVYFVNAKAAALLNRVPPSELRAVAAGVRIFTWKRVTADGVGAVPCSEGISIVATFANRRRTSIPEADARRLLEAGNNGVPLAELADGERLLAEPPGGHLLEVSGSAICYGAIRIGGKLRVYLKRPLVAAELLRLREHFSS
jgi:tRNA (cytosine34-C5)-methyltransferase